MKELDAALTALSELNRSMTEAIQSMREMFSSSTEPAQAGEAPASVSAPAPKSYTIEEVRAVLLEKRRSGHKDEIRALLAAHGAERLTDIDPKEYPAMMREAEEIGI